MNIILTLKTRINLRAHNNADSLDIVGLFFKVWVLTEVAHRWDSNQNLNKAAQQTMFNGKFSIQDSLLLWENELLVTRIIFPEANQWEWKGKIIMDETKCVPFYCDYFSLFRQRRSISLDILVLKLCESR